MEDLFQRNERGYQTPSIVQIKAVKRAVGRKGGNVLIKDSDENEGFISVDKTKLRDG